MEIKFLKAGSGDCILIHNEGKNILIDGGNESLYLIEEYNKLISKEEQIDLLIVTHHDDDHIKGLLDLFDYIEKKGKLPKIDTVIFNSPRKINNSLTLQTQSKLLSYHQAFLLENYLLRHSKIKWKTSIDDDINTSFKDKFGALNLEFFSPTKEILSEYSNNKGAYLISDKRCDWNTSLKELNRYIDDKSQDISPSNRTSIVVLLTFNTSKILLTSDVTPDRLQDIINQIKGQEEIISFDYIKLPHHASYRSLNSELLQKVNCSNYIISTNGHKYYLPNKRALLKIINNHKSKKPIEFIFNYEEVITKLEIKHSELVDYKIKLEKNNNDWGYGIDI